MTCVVEEREAVSIRFMAWKNTPVIDGGSNNRGQYSVITPALIAAGSGIARLAGYRRAVSSWLDVYPLHRRFPSNAR